MNGKTIQIFLLSGNPEGIKKAEIKTDKIEIILSSRKDFIENKDIFDFMGVYILVSSIQDEKPELYIGQGKVKTRLIQHEDEKDFWNFVFTIRLKTEEGFNDSHVLYIENYFIEQAKKSGRSTIIQNKQSGRQTRLEESIVCELNDYIQTINILLSTLGLKAFQFLTNKGKNKNEIFICKNTLGSYGIGEYTEEGFIIFKGSKCRKEIIRSLKNTSTERCRNELIKKGILKEEGNIYIVTEDYKTSSPSCASGIILAVNSNGWTDWKNENGKTLDEVYRKKENN